MIRYGMRRTRLWAVGLAVMLASCTPGSRSVGDPPAAVPLVLEQPATPFPQAELTDENRARLGELVTGFLVDATLNQDQPLAPAPGTSDLIVPLQPGQDHRVDVTLAPGRWYRFLGACDYECRNVDLELIDAEGVVVIRDLYLNDFPSMDYMSETGGVFTLRLMMRTCVIAPCFAGARMVTQP